MAGLYVFVECAWCLRVSPYFNKKKTNFSFREIARLITRNLLYFCFNHYSIKVMGIMVKFFLDQFL